MTARPVWRAALAAEDERLARLTPEQRAGELEDARRAWAVLFRAYGHPAAWTDYVQVYGPEAAEAAQAFTLQLYAQWCRDPEGFITYGADLEVEPWTT